MSEPVTPQKLQTLQLPVELTRQQPLRRRGLWLMLALAGLLLAAAETLWLSQDFWLRQPAVRNLLTPLLDQAGYTLKRPQLTAAWRVSALTLRAEPAAAGVWHVDALLQHHADILQPWPVLQLSLRDWQGRLAGQRRLLPADYLPEGLPRHLGPQALTGSGQPVRIHVAVRIPAQADGQIPVFEQAELSAQP